MNKAKDLYYLEIILRYIDEYQRGKCSLNPFCSHLENLIDEIKNKKLHTSLISSWLAIEIINAHILNEERKINSREIEDIEKELSLMRLNINEYLMPTKT